MLDAAGTVAGALMADATASFGPGFKEGEVLSVNEGADRPVELLPRQRRTKIKIQIRNYKRLNVFAETKSKL